MVDTPLELHIKFSAPDGIPLEDPTEYRELVDCVVYFIVIRLDIAFVIHIVSQFVYTPWFTHWASLLCILGYVRGTLHRCLRAYAD